MAATAHGNHGSRRPRLCHGFFPVPIWNDSAQIRPEASWHSSSPWFLTLSHCSNLSASVFIAPPHLFRKHGVKDFVVLACRQWRRGSIEWSSRVIGSSIAICSSCSSHVINTIFTLIYPSWITLPIFPVQPGVPDWDRYQCHLGMVTFGSEPWFGPRFVPRGEPNRWSG